MWGGTTTTQPPALVEAFCAQWGLTRLQVSSQFSNIRRSKKWLREQRLATSGSSPSRSSAIGGEGGAPDPTLLMPSSQQQQPGAQDGLPALWHPLKRWRNARGSNCAVCRKHKKRCDGTQLGCLKAAGGGAEAGPGPAAQRPEEGEEEGLQPPPPPPAAAQKARWTAYTTKTPAQTAVRGYFRFHVCHRSPICTP